MPPPPASSERLVQKIDVRRVVRQATAKGVAQGTLRPARDASGSLLR